MNLCQGIYGRRAQPFSADGVLSTTGDLEIIDDSTPRHQDKVNLSAKPRLPCCKMLRPLKAVGVRCRWVCRLQIYVDTLFKVLQCFPVSRCSYLKHAEVIVHCPSMIFVSFGLFYLSHLLQLHMPIVKAHFQARIISLYLAALPLICVIWSGALWSLLFPLVLCKQLPARRHLKQYML